MVKASTIHGAGDEKKAKEHFKNSLSASPYDLDTIEEEPIDMSTQPQSALSEEFSYNEQDIRRSDIRENRKKKPFVNMPIGGGTIGSGVSY